MYGLYRIDCLRSMRHLCWLFYNMGTMLSNGREAEGEAGQKQASANERIDQPGSLKKIF
jgi:hypothetical protein